MDYIYIAFIRSNTKAGVIIRKLTGWKYSHVSITFDKKKFYAFSRLNFESSFLAGYKEEYKSNYTLLKSTPAEITYYKLPIKKNEYNHIMKFIHEIKKDNEYIFNYPSMVTTTIIHGFELYKSYNCITFVSKILTFISELNMSKKYYKYDLNELEQDVKDFYDKKEEVVINKLTSENDFFDKISKKERKQAERKLLYECFYRLLFHKVSKKYDIETYKKNLTISNFNKQSKVYDNSYYSHNPRKNYEEIINLIDIKDNITILDVGCGTGEILNKLYNINNNTNLYGIDISSEMITVAKLKNKNVKYSIGDAEYLPFEDNKFDILITSESFHHYINPMKALNEFKRVLKPNAILILCDMYRPFPIRNIMNLFFQFINTGDVKIYNKKQMEKMLISCDFKINFKSFYYYSYIYEAMNDKRK